ncbi:origin recognition complex subunit 1-like [Etheostoma cragini]|uniref:origin recognition complex subunit 1-like n=1 Tax=Etheostoma cragini TaxID=417921 RepID=UPI00155F1968|nr:origin recognition complex subunit 1-like [Etheostoma cragini]
MKYFTRLRVRRVYKWRGEPLSFNRKLKTYEYGSLEIRVEGLPRTTVISTGQHILIEGEDEDNPYVAKVVRLYGDESGRQKKALVQWFVRVFEVPLSKRRLLGREPHPQEIFYYRGRSCDDEVDAESILRPVQCSPPAPRGSARRALPTPDFAVMRRAAGGEAEPGRATLSARRAGAAEAESRHSATKLSASKCLSSRRRTASARTPGVRKKLELSSPEKTFMIRDDVLTQLLQEELEADVMLAQRLSASPPQALPPPHTLTHTPARKTHQAAAFPLKPSAVKLARLPEADSPLPSAGRDSTRASTPSRRPEQKTQKEPALGVLEVTVCCVSPGSGLLQDVGGLSGRQRPAGDAGSGAMRSPWRAGCDLSKQETVKRDKERVLRPERGVAADARRLFFPNTSSSSLSASSSSSSSSSLLWSSFLEGTNSSSSSPSEFRSGWLSRRILLRHEETSESALSARCMYISGVPGTGKTATVHEVMRCLQHAADVDEIPPFHFVEINGMKMTDPHQAYVQILQKLTGQKATADHAAALLEKRFSNAAPRKETTVLLVDELDLLWTRKQNVMYNLFDWPTRRHARLVVLTIANTMDLPERIMINRVASRLGLTRMSFQPYSFKQLQQIIMSRLNKVKAFEQDALQLVSRKVAALSGDARRCLDICRRATEICEHSAADPSASGLVGMSHVMEALDEMFSSAYITAIKCASVQEQLFLRAVIAEFRRLGLEEATFQQVFVQHQALCRVEGLQPVSVSEGLAVCQRLGACRLLLLEPSRLGVLQRVRLNVSQDDVLFALKAD